MAKAAQNFALTIHEIATDAAKYGALSNASGIVQIAWNIDQPTGVLTFHWQERDGLPVAAPARKGFGSVVLEQLMVAYYDQQPQVEFNEHGLTYSLICSLDAVPSPAHPLRSGRSETSSQATSRVDANNSRPDSHYSS